ncbi:hypothetical protein EMIHUDRAFT_238675 [Emiliania huxleyi CCMP1516]|uniref:G-patch domain-containing protein n=2 Tax=Emiliania huxleyi TaxID=2903 RepID=A0A0D3JLE0_EMIH1|nr:hypothetical protein EMIHUDRAFT_238675 [Emiliania huxleyi CCMP1516]EOD24325.1 hypothetical protein EMIHUDRAFT_238675 [Emiliania huxleyi CCMP1516]|eukprot:XP_005776754.1 hypothetical protein EMIHUDRAFT_238675 [Emiliania huxleyi CCMP1516]
MLLRMGWVEGQGLGRRSSGSVTPVAVSAVRLLEGKGSERFITVSKREGGVTEAVLEAQSPRARTPH